MSILPSTEVKLSQIASTFAPGKAAPHRFSEFYKGGTYVAVTDTNPFVVPATGVIGIGNFRSAAKYIAPVNKSVNVTNGSFTMPSDVQNTRITAFTVKCALRQVWFGTYDGTDQSAPISQGTNTVVFRCNETLHTASLTYTAYYSMFSNGCTFDFTHMKHTLIPGQTYTFSIIYTEKPWATQWGGLGAWENGTFAYTVHNVIPPSPYTNLGFLVSLWIGTNSWGGVSGVSINETNRMDSLALTTPTRSGRTQVLIRMYNQDEQYSNSAQKYVGYFVPQATGSHVFSIGGDDFCMMWLGANAATPGTTNTSANYFVRSQFGVSDGTNTATINLTAGVAYPVLVYYGETNWSGYLSLSVTPPGGSATSDFLGYVFH